MHHTPTLITSHSLMPIILRVRIRRIAIHAIIQHIPALRDGIAPEGLGLDAEAAHDAAEDAPEREGDRAPVAVEPARGAVPVPPVLPVPDDPPRVVRVEREVSPSHDEP